MDPNGKRSHVWPWWISVPTVRRSPGAMNNANCQFSAENFPPHHLPVRIWISIRRKFIVFRQTVWWLIDLRSQLPQNASWWRDYSGMIAGSFTDSTSASESRPSRLEPYKCHRNDTSRAAIINQNRYFPNMCLIVRQGGGIDPLWFVQVMMTSTQFHSTPKGYGRRLRRRRWRAHNLARSMYGRLLLETSFRCHPVRSRAISHLPALPSPSSLSE